MKHEHALALVLAQGFGSPQDHGPHASQTIEALLPCIHTARERGYSTITEMFAPAMTAMAARVRHRNGQVFGYRWTGRSAGALNFTGPSTQRKAHHRETECLI